MPGPHRRPRKSRNLHGYHLKSVRRLRDSQPPASVLLSALTMSSRRPAEPDFFAPTESEAKSFQSLSPGQQAALQAVAVVAKRKSDEALPAVITRAEAMGFTKRQVLRTLKLCVVWGWVRWLAARELTGALCGAAFATRRRSSCTSSCQRC